VVREGIVHPQQDPFGSVVGLGRGRPPELGHDVVARVVRVVDEEATVRLVFRMEREPEQAPLPTGLHLIPDVEERALRGTRPVEGLDPARLLDDVQAAGLAPGRCHVHTRVEA
jgi:hypothetical protein